MSAPEPYFSDGQVSLYLGDCRGRRAIGVEANEEYAEKAARRLSQATLFGEAAG